MPSVRSCAVLRIVATELLGLSCPSEGITCPTSPTWRISTSTASGAREAAPGTSSTSIRTTARSSRRSRSPRPTRSTRPTAPPSAPSGTGPTTNPYARRLVFETALRIIEDREQEITEAIIAELGGTRLKAAFELHLAKEFLREAVHLALRARGPDPPLAGRRQGEPRLPRAGRRRGRHQPLQLPLPAVAEVGRAGARPRQRGRPQAAPEHPDRAAAPWSPRSSRTRACRRVC